MSKIKSIFGAYAEKLQVMVDSSLDKFAPLWFPNYFDWGIPQTSLTFTGVVGRSRIEAAASVIARGSAAPLRSRAALEKYSGEIPPISEKFAMDEQAYRDYMTLQALQVSDSVKKSQLLNLMFDDVKKAGDSAMKRMEIMTLEAISTGKISLTLTNNPDGVVLANALDLLMPAGNKKNAAVTWSTVASATPLVDINTMVDYFSGLGVKAAKMLMTRATFLKMIKTTEVKEAVGTFMGARSVTKVMPTLQNVNDFLDANQLPIIEIVDVAIGVEKDGVISTIRPFEDTNVAFVPAGKLGKIHNAIAIEEMRPVESVSYAKYNNALISKWAQNEPFLEYTKVELNAFPGLDTIDAIGLLSTTVAF